MNNNDYVKATIKHFYISRIQLPLRTSGRAAGMKLWTFLSLLVISAVIPTARVFGSNIVCNLTVTTSSTQVSCYGGYNGIVSVFPANGVSPYTYAWSNGGTAYTINGLTAGTGGTTYTVMVTDNLGCTATASVSISEPATAVTALLLSETGVLCAGTATGTASAGGSGGTPGYSYLWSNVTTNAEVTGIAAASYTVTVSDANACTATATITITAPPALTGTITTTATSCYLGNNGTATANAAGGTLPYAYIWSDNNSQTSATATGLPIGSYTVTITDANACTVSYYRKVSEPSQLRDSINAQNCNGNSGAASIGLKGGTAPYTFLWMPSGQTTIGATGLSNGTYTVNVTDNNGCSTSATVSFNCKAIVVKGISATAALVSNVSCYGGDNGNATATVSGGTGPYTYSWSDGITTNPTGSFLSAGAYTVTITDANNNMATASVIINQPASAITSTESVISNVRCNGGNSGSVQVNSGGGTSPYTYRWSNGAITSSASGLTAGTGGSTYTVTVTDNHGCTSSATISITEPVQYLTTVTAISNITCNGSKNGSVQVSVSGGIPPYTFLWSNGAVTSVNSGLTAGTGGTTYTVTVTDNNDCSATATISIKEPVQVTGRTAVINNVGCIGGDNGKVQVTAGGGALPYTYLWSNGDKTSNLTGLTAGTGGTSYIVTVTDNHGCTSEASVNLSEPQSGLTAVVLTSTGVLCAGGATGTATATGLGGTPVYTYSWNNGQTNATATALAAATYTVTVKDAGSCSATATVTITHPNALTVSITTVATSCYSGNNGTATVLVGGGTKPYIYKWNDANSQTGATATGLSSGSYTVIATDANGCTTTIYGKVSQPSQFIGVIIDQKCTGSSGGATFEVSGGTAPYIYSWKPSGGTKQVASGLSKGTYSVTSTDHNGCTVSATVTFTCVAEEPGPINKGGEQDECCEDLAAGDNITLYPNPTTGDFTITGISKEATVEIYNILGQSISAAKGNNNKQFNISSQPNGIYLIRIIGVDGNLIGVKKVVKSL